MVKKVVAGKKIVIPAHTARVNGKKVKVQKKTIKLPDRLVKKDIRKP